MAFIDDHREEYGAEPICVVLPIAPSTYYHHKAREADPEKIPERAKRDEQLRAEIQRVWKNNFQVYGCARFGANSTGKATPSRAAPWLA